ncbi:MAG: hypothetical protein JWO31_881 [Phycisphaerales bacterium]|nr:hypothetical protein [Phycisphaerales bacterium]
MPDSKSTATRLGLRTPSSAPGSPGQAGDVRLARAARAAIGRRPASVLERLEGRQFLSASIVGGYTVVAPADDTRVVYVSSLNGSDGNDGLSTNSPLKSIAKGKSLLRNGAGDQLLLERGSTFSEGLGYWKISGKSADQPLLVGTYGTGDRPLITDATSYAFGAGSGGASNKLHDVVIEGIRFYASRRDPSNPAFDATDKTDGVYIAGNVDNLTFDDVSVEFYANNFVVSPYFGPVTDFKLRNSNVSNSWAKSSHSQGMYLEGITGVLLENNTFDHNGWNEQIPGAGATVFNHSVYVQGTNRDAVARNNVFANAGSHGLQMRAGGIVENNLFINDPIGLSFGLVNGGGPLVPGGVVGVVKDNVFIGGRNIGSEVRGLGMEIANTRPGASVVVEKNIFTKAYAGGAFAAINVSYGKSQANGELAAGINDLSIKDNIVYEWTRGLWVAPELTGAGTGPKSVNNLSFDNNDWQDVSSSNLVYQGIGTGNGNVTYANDRYYSGNGNGAPFYLAGRTYSMNGWFGAVEATGEAVKANYVDPDRTMDTYSFTLGGSGTTANFLANARVNAQGAFNAGYTAAAANNYIRAGFLDRGDATPAIPGGYVPTQSPIYDTISLPPATGSDGVPLPVPPPIPTPIPTLPPVSPPVAPNPGSSTPVPTSPPYTTIIGPDGKPIIVWTGGSSSTGTTSPPTAPTLPGGISTVPNQGGTAGGGLSYGGGFWYIP